MPGTFTVVVQEARGLVAVDQALDALAVVVGCTSAGTGLSPWYGSGQAAKGVLGFGDAVDDVCQIIEQIQPDTAVKVPCACYTVPAVTEGGYGTINVTGKSGTSAVTVDAATHPYGTYEPYLFVSKGGTIGVAGIELQWSLNGGRSLSDVVSLGTATSYTIPESNARFAFGTGTLVTGDIVRVRTTAPQPSAAGITAACNALAQAAVQFRILVVECDLTIDIANALKVGRAKLATAGKRVLVLTRSRLPDFETSESEATWIADVKADFASFTDSTMARVDLYGLVTDAMTARQYVRSALGQVAADIVRVPISTWPDCPADRSIGNVTLIDNDGTLIGHDEGQRGNATGLSDPQQGGKGICAQRVPSRGEDVYTTVPWVLFASDERIRTVMARRIANAMESDAIDAGTSGMGGKIAYRKASGNVPARLTDNAMRDLQKVIFGYLSPRYADHVENASDAALDTGLVQVQQNVTVSDSQLVGVSVTLAPMLFGHIVKLTVTMAIQN
jgi:hypothetical protein